MNKLSGWLHAVNKKEEPKRSAIPISENDPRLYPAKEYTAANGGDPKLAFIKMAKDQGYSIPENATPYDALKIIMSSGYTMR